MPLRSISAWGVQLQALSLKSPLRTSREPLRYTVNLGKPIAYKEFKALSESLQKEYLKDIFAKYNVGMSAVAELLGVPVSTCASKLHKLGFTFPRGFKPSKEDLERFRADFGLADAPAKK